MPTTSQLHDALEGPQEVALDVLIDSDTVTEDGSCFEALSVLLATHGVRTWRYCDDGPPVDVERAYSPGAPGDVRAGAPFDWLEVFAVGEPEPDQRRATVTHVARHFDGRTSYTANVFGEPSRPSEQTAPALVLRSAAVATGMAMLITRRPELTPASESGWHGGTLLQKPEAAVATLGLLLRNAGSFPVMPYSVTKRSSYLWLALDSVLPHYGAWAAACSADGVAGPGRIHYLATATEGRLLQVLNTRDQVAVAISRPQVDWVDVADALDRFLVFLLAAMDSTARVAGELACPGLKVAGVKWQSHAFREKLRPDAPALAELFDSDTAAADLHQVLRSLRNTIHSGGLSQTHTLVDERDLEHKLSVPLDEVPGLPQAVERRTDGKPERWGLHVTDDRVWIQPRALTEALTRGGLSALDAIFEKTPMHALDAMAAEADNIGKELEYEPDPVEQSNAHFVARMLATRGSDMYLWHLGLHPEQSV